MPIESPNREPTDREPKKQENNTKEIDHDPKRANAAENRPTKDESENPTFQEWLTQRIQQKQTETRMLLKGSRISDVAKEAAKKTENNK